MNLKHAILIATEDTREANPEQSWTPEEAIPFIRECMTDADVVGGIDDPKVQQAYYAVLHATPGQIAKALG